MLDMNGRVMKILRIEEDSKVCIKLNEISSRTYLLKIFGGETVIYKSFFNQ
jgi:hypothetical protein